MEAKDNGCGTKHLKLAGGILAAVAMLVLTVLFWFTSTVQASLKEVRETTASHDVRLRASEQANARIEERVTRNTSILIDIRDMQRRMLTDYHKEAERK